MLCHRHCILQILQRHLVLFFLLVLTLVLFPSLLFIIISLRHSDILLLFLLPIITAVSVVVGFVETFHDDEMETFATVVEDMPHVVDLAPLGQVGERDVGLRGVVRVGSDGVGHGDGDREDLVVRALFAHVKHVVRVPDRVERVGDETGLDPLGGGARELGYGVEVLGGPIDIVMGKLCAQDADCERALPAERVLARLFLGGSFGADLGGLEPQGFCDLPRRGLVDDDQLDLSSVVGKGKRVRVLYAVGLERLERDVANGDDGRGARGGFLTQRGGGERDVDGLVRLVEVEEEGLVPLEGFGHVGGLCGPGRPADGKGGGDRVVDVLDVFGRDDADEHGACPGHPGGERVLDLVVCRVADDEEADLGVRV